MPPAPPSSAAAAAAHRSTPHPSSDLRGLCEHGIQDCHLAAKQRTASAPLRFFINGALAGLLARLAGTPGNAQRRQQAPQPHTVDPQPRACGHRSRYGDMVRRPVPCCNSGPESRERAACRRRSRLWVLWSARPSRRRRCGRPRGACCCETAESPLRGNHPAPRCTTRGKGRCGQI